MGESLEGDSHYNIAPGLLKPRSETINREKPCSPPRHKITRAHCQRKLKYLVYQGNYSNKKIPTEINFSPNDSILPINNLTKSYVHFQGYILSTSTCNCFPTQDIQHLIKMNGTHNKKQVGQSWWWRRQENNSFGKYKQ